MSPIKPLQEDIRLGKAMMIQTRLTGRLTRNIPGLKNGYLVPWIGLHMSITMRLMKLFGQDPAMDMTDAIVKIFSTRSLNARIISLAFGNPNGPGPDEKAVKDHSGGSGPFKSRMLEHDSLPNHTIYLPSQTPKWPLPVVCWANGFGLPAGTMFANFLNEIASHGYMVVANGPIDHKGKLGKTTRGPELLDVVDWVTKSPWADHLGVQIDRDHIVVAGQSLGGLNAYFASQHPRVTAIMLFNSGNFDHSADRFIPKITVPIAYFQGGRRDFAQLVGRKDYEQLPPTAPALWATVDVGHIGTYYQMYGGRYGKLAVAYLDWIMRGEPNAKSLFFDPAPDSPLVVAGFIFEMKNGMSDL